LGGVVVTFVRLTVTLSPTLNVYPRIVTGRQSWTVKSSSKTPIGIPSMVAPLPSSGSSSGGFFGSYERAG
jgi:hypothetical protein